MGARRSEMEPIGDILARVKVPSPADFLPLFRPSGPRGYWCRLCPASLQSCGYQARHAAEHEDAGEAALDNGQWVTTRRLVDAYEATKKQRARMVL